jgi:hypothetical protein
MANTLLKKIAAAIIIVVVTHEVKKWVGSDK